MYIIYYILYIEYYILNIILSIEYYILNIYIYILYIIYHISYITNIFFILYILYFIYYILNIIYYILYILYFVYINIWIHWFDLTRPVTLLWVKDGSSSWNTKSQKGRLAYIASLLCNQRVSKSLCTICLADSDSCILLSRSIGCALCWLLSGVLNPKSGHVVWSDNWIWRIPNCLPVSILARIGCLDLLAPRPAMSGGPRNNN